MGDGVAMGRQVPVEVAGTTFYVEVAADPEASLESDDGVSVVGALDTLSLTGVRQTIEAIAGELERAWEVARPSTATVEFSLKVVAKGGKLTGLLVEGGGEAALKVSLSWDRGDD